MAKTPRPPGFDGLEKAASRLSPIEREVLILSARDRLRPREIADRLGISTEAAERHLVDALCRLDRHLRRQERPRWRFWRAPLALLPGPTIRRRAAGSPGRRRPQS